MVSRKDIMYQHMIAFQGIDGKINNTLCRFLICEETDNNENNYDLKYVITDQAIKQGDYITFDDTLFMIIDVEKPINCSYGKGTFREVLKITLEVNLKDIYAVVDKVSGVFSQGTEITEVHDEYSFIIPKSVTNMTSSTPSNNAIIYAGGSYDAISIDDSKEGILTITGRFDSIYNPHIYTINLSENTRTLVGTETCQIIATATDNGIVIENPTIAYTSSNENVATVSETGVITGMGVGSTTIKCSYNNVSTDFTIVVEEKPLEPVINYIENWSQTTTIKQYVTSTYTVTRTSDGVVETPTISYIFDSTGQALISASKIVVTNKAINSFSVKNSTITTTTTCYVSIIDTATNKVIANQLLTFTKGV